MLYLDRIGDWLESDTAISQLSAVAVALVGIVLARSAGRIAQRYVLARRSEQDALVARRVAFYSVLWMTLLLVLDRLGIELRVLLGAAGVLTVAVGFASQTSASNVISGMFLMGERPFVIGDAIRVGSNEGEVMSIDWLSVKLRTWQNTFVRIPNEMLIKTEIENLTRFPIRRVDLPLDVGYEQDLDAVETCLLQLADTSDYCLQEPEAAVRVTEFGASGVRLTFLVWMQSTGYIENRTRLLTEVRRAFTRANIVIPYQQVVLHHAQQPAADGVPATARTAPGPSRGAEPTTAGSMPKTS